MQWGLQEGTTTQTQEKPQHTTERFLWWVLHQESRRQWGLPLQTTPPRHLSLRTQPLISTEWREPYRWLWGRACLHRDGWNWRWRTGTAEEWGWGARRVCVWGDEVPSPRWYGVPHWPCGVSLCMPHSSTLWSWTSQSLLHTSKHSSLWHSCTLSQLTHPSPSIACVPTSTSSVFAQLRWVSPHPPRCDQIANAGEPVLQQIPNILLWALICTHSQGAHRNPNPHRLWTLFCTSSTLYTL